MGKTPDLNDLQVQNDGNFPDLGFVDNSIEIASAQVAVYFRRQKGELIKRILSVNCVVGCIAWLTDFDIIQALSKVEFACIVVQKEDFLRPDLNAKANFGKQLREQYGKLRNSSCRFAWPGLMRHLSMLGDPKLEPVRCVGNHNSLKEPAFPRMHNKFLVFGDLTARDDTDGYAVTIALQEVWTGSYNLTRTAAHSLENAVAIRNPAVAEAYYKEFCQIYALSEPLNWESKWIAPEFRIGT